MQSKSAFKSDKYFADDLFLFSNIDLDDYFQVTISVQVFQHHHQALLQELDQHKKGLSFSCFFFNWF